jgi:hypothetical protein
MTNPEFEKFAIQQRLVEFVGRQAHTEEEASRRENAWNQAPATIQ